MVLLCSHHLPLDLAHKELIEIARRSEPSVLRKRSYDGMSEINWMAEVAKELSTRCPVVNNIQLNVLDHREYNESKNAALCLIYGIIMFLRSHELSRIHRITQS